MILVDMRDVAVRRPPLFEGLSVTVKAGDRLGVVGRNGSGKSTLLRVLAGAAEPDEGTIRRGRGVSTAVLDQRPELPPGTVADAVGRHWEAAAMLDRLGMGGAAGEDVSTLSGGQAKRVALAQVLLAGGDLLVLDEPTNHLDLPAVAWLSERLAGFRGGVVLVSHDRHLLDSVTSRTLELDQGRAWLHDGGYQSYLAARTERAEREAAAETVRRNLARAELAWLRRGAPARTRKPKARLAAAAAVVEGRAPEPDREPLGLGAMGTPRLGDKVVRLEGVGHRHGDGPWLFRHLDLDLDRRGRIGVVGPNGSGKSTLLDVLAGRIEPAAGRVDRGPTVRTGYYDQTGRDLDPEWRVRDAVAGRAGTPSGAQVRLMERFWFDGDAQWAPIGTLSGGEQRRLQLLLVLAALPNLLLLDEPTNDLDLDTLRALEDFLDQWPGSLVVVSHDRAHLERTVEEVLVVDGGTAQVLPGLPPVAARAGGRAGPSGPSGAGRAPRAARAPRDEPRRARSQSTLRHLLARAERELADAGAVRDELAARLAAGGDHQALARLAEELAHAQARLDEAEERWLELAEHF